MNNKMMSSYTNMTNYLNEKGCKMLSTEEEAYAERRNGFYKIKYIASCGHENEVFFNVFKSRGTGILCTNCKRNQMKNNKKQQIQNNEISPIQNIISECKFIIKFQELTKDKFNMVKAFDGCKVDLIYKPKNISEDKWVGIQVKTNNKIHLTYCFNISKKEYKDCIIALYCHEDDSLWIMPENTLASQEKISIGKNKSKYNIYKVEKDNIINKLEELYYNTTKFSFETLDTPINIYQQREKEFRLYRQSKINFINFIYEEMEATVYDFKINNCKIQEKVITSRTDNMNLYLFNIVKNNSNKLINKSHCQYSIGDNDFYWINCIDKVIFFVIPEQILMNKGYVGNQEGPIKFSLNPYKLTEKTNWIEPYMFNYNTINEEENKTRLLSLFNLVG